MAAGVFNFKVEQGIKYSFNAFYKTGNQEVIPLTDYSAKGEIKYKMSDKSPVAEFTFTIVPAEGKLVVTLPANALDSLVFKGNTFNDYVQLVYDIIIYKANDNESPIRLLNGVIDVSPKVTNKPSGIGV